jgi:hypothetical protein
MATVGYEVRLTEEEQELFATLLAAAAHAGTGTIVRCAGGWVRDKLLGKDSKDIDIALDNMLGREFGDKVRPQLVHPSSWQCHSGGAAQQQQAGMWQALAHLPAADCRAT